MGCCGPFFQKNVVAVLFKKCRDEVIDEGCVDERCIGVHAHDYVGIEQFCGAGEPRQHVIFGAAHHGDIVVACPFRNRVVARIGGGRDGDFLDESRALKAMDYVPEQGLSRYGLQHLAGQTC